MISIENTTFSYTGVENADGVRNINLTISKGQFVVLCGESGCGKTTITRLINGLIPHYYEGTLTGKVTVNDNEMAKQLLYETSETVGSVFQNPRSQFFNVDTTSELTFGCENLGWSEAEIFESLQKATSDFTLEKLIGRNIFQLSGGEKQKIACAAVSMMHSDVLVLDEPSSNLDAKSIAELREILAFWKSQGKTVVVSEHRLFYLRELADRFVYLKDGEIVSDYSAQEFSSLTEQDRTNMGLRTYALENLMSRATLVPAKQMTIRDFHFAYKNQPEILHIDECSIPAHSITAIIGNNGAGKSTYARCFCGLEKRCGQVIWEDENLSSKLRLNTCYMVMQEVNHQLFTQSVLEEVLISMDDADEKQAESTLESLDLLPFKDRHPMSLSGGQKQRVAIASAVASKRRILFFDEPTSGLDFRHMQEAAAVLQNLQESGKTLFVITHDLELILECCTNVIRVDDGKIAEQYTMDELGLKKIRDYFISE